MNNGSNEWPLCIPGETFQEAITDAMAVRVAKQSGLEKQILDVGEWFKSCSEMVPKYY